MLAYILRRLMAVIPVMLMVATIVFLLIHFAPGDPAAMLAGADATMAEIETTRARLGLDKPLHIQLLDWFKGLFTGNLGNSIFYDTPVTQVMARRLEPTLMLVVISIVIASVLGVSVGVVSAIKYGTFTDELITFLSTIGISIPSFWLGMNLILVFGVSLRWIPVSGYVALADGFWACLRSVIAPSVSVALVNCAFIARMTRASMLETLRQDYVRTAKAMGHKDRVVHFKYTLKNAIIPIITVIGICMSATLGGIVVIETIFTIPGMGRLLMQSVLRRDYPLIQGIILYVALAYLFISLVVDVLYAFVNPRIRFE